VNQRGGGERVPRILIRHIQLGGRAQLVVYERKQFIGGVPVTPRGGVYQYCGICWSCGYGHDRMVSRTMGACIGLDQESPDDTLES